MRTDVVVDWTIPDTSPGWIGHLERFVGPGKTARETVVELVGGVLGVTALAAIAVTDESVRSWSVLQLVLGSLLALDLVGGVLTNATNAAKRWYHRPGPGRRRARLVFVASHVVHLAVVAFVLLPGDTRWWWTQVGLLVAGAVLVEWAPVDVKRPTAFAAVVCAVAVGQAAAPLTGVLALVPVLFHLKLLVGHLVPEAPLARVVPEAPLARVVPEVRP